MTFPPSNLVSASKVRPKRHAAERTHHREESEQEEGLSQEEPEDDEDYADIEHNFDNEEDEEELMQRLEQIGDSGRSKHKTFEGIPK